MTGKLQSIDRFKQLGLAVLTANLIYLTWLGFNVRGVAGAAFFSTEIAIFILTLLFVINHWNRKYQLTGGRYSLRAPVDVFIPVVDEPLKMVEGTVKAATAIDHPSTMVYLLDDGGRSEVRKLASDYGCQYLCRADREANRCKAANLNYGLKHSYGAYILVIDADHAVRPTILDELLGHFKGKNVALVASRQAFAVAEHDFNHDHLFYNYMQSGKNTSGVAISCGSGVIYSRSCLNKIGGFSEWNLVEDLYTTYMLNSAGYRSVYVPQPYTIGHAPNDLSQIYKQRGTWALDSLRMFFWRQPLLNRRLSLRQRLHYFELGYCYLVSAIFIPGIFYLNFYSLAANESLINDGWWYLVIRLPALILTLAMFGRFSQGQLTSRVWAGLFPVYQVAAVKALLHRQVKPVYRVTSKVDHGKRELKLVTPQILTVALGLICLVYSLSVYGTSSLLIFNAFWLGVMGYWLWPVVYKAYSTRPKPTPV